MDLFAATTTDKLIIPDHFIQWKRDILLRLKGDNPLDFLLAERRQLHEARENRLLGDRVGHPPALDLQLRQHLGHRGGHLRGADSFIGWFNKDFSRPVITQNQPSRRSDSKFRQLDALRTEIQRDDACPGGHDGENPKTRLPSKSKTALTRGSSKSQAPTPGKLQAPINDEQRRDGRQLFSARSLAEYVLRAKRVWQEH